MAWRIEYADSVLKQLKKLDKETARRILNYLDENVAPLDDPRTIGKSLTGQLGSFWRYRMEDYRIVCHIEQTVVTVLVLRISHRSTAYGDQKAVSKRAQKDVETFRSKTRNE
ncbi:MAG: type II toxin-antitoxin system RelE/ParE family toxin [Cyanobacteria bacterium SZAS TMP-1]|nr:type II toxin-antitoxin system RelE/ParE family toxin [Cyanobacteria bacterium SZAS TMP-1]